MLREEVKWNHRKCFIKTRDDRTREKKKQKLTTKFEKKDINTIDINSMVSI